MAPEDQPTPDGDERTPIGVLLWFGWAFVLLGNAAVTMWLLLTEPVHIFVMAKTLSTAILTTAAVIGSSLWFRASMHRHGLLAPKPAPGARA